MCPFLTTRRGELGGLVNCNWDRNSRPIATAHPTCEVEKPGTWIELQWCMLSPLGSCYPNRSHSAQGRHWGFVCKAHAHPQACVTTSQNTRAQGVPIHAEATSSPTSQIWMQKHTHSAADSTKKTIPSSQEPSPAQTLNPPARLCPTAPPAAPVPGWLLARRSPPS